VSIIIRKKKNLFLIVSLFFIDKINPIIDKIEAAILIKFITFSIYDNSFKLFQYLRFTGESCHPK
jgi:hypothetical protein